MLRRVFAAYLALTLAFTTGVLPALAQTPDASIKPLFDLLESMREVQRSGLGVAPGPATPAAARPDPKALVVPVSQLGPGWTQLLAEPGEGDERVARAYTVGYLNGPTETASIGAIINVTVAAERRDVPMEAMVRVFERAGWSAQVSDDYGDRGVRATSREMPGYAVRVFVVQNVAVVLMVLEQKGRTAEGDRLLATLARAEERLVDEALGLPTRRSEVDTSGQLAGGQSALYQFSYPGDESVYTINLQVDPDSVVGQDKAGFEVYNPTGALVIKGGAQSGLRPNVSANVISRMPGQYTVKVYNNLRGVTVDYALDLVAGRPEGK